jgi:urease accessory protein
VFRSLPIVHETYREESCPPRARAYRRDTITLSWEDRLKSRGRRRSDGGLEFGTALPRGTTLRAGDCLVLDDTSTLVLVVERPEPVFVIEPQTPSEWARFAYHIGNSHQPVMITDRAIVCPELPGMGQVLEQHAIRFSRDVRPFTPLAPPVDHRHQS